VLFSSTTFGAGVNASHCPITCPKRQLPVTLNDIPEKSSVFKMVEEFGA
jgi:hypothetical protein